MRKPRDFDAELKALTDKAVMLKARRVQQLGELVIATGAHAVDPETLAGVLLACAETKDAAQRDKWRMRGKGFFQGQSRSSNNQLSGNVAGNPTKQDGGTAG